MENSIINDNIDDIFVNLPDFKGYNKTFGHFQGKNIGKFPITKPVEYYPK